MKLKKNHTHMGTSLVLPLVSIPGFTIALLLGMATGLFSGNASLASAQDLPTQPVEAGKSNRPSQFEDFKGDGYYWYKQEPLPSKPKPVVPPLVAPVPPVAAAPAKEEVRPLSSEWMRANMPKLLDKAVDNPTKENVANYMYAQRVLLDKSQNFSDKVKEVVATDPFLDENNRVPIAQFAQPAFAKGVKDGENEVLDHLGTHAGLWVFIDTPDKCSACEGYVSNILVGSKASKGVATKHGINLRQISVNSAEGKTAAKRLNLKLTPTTVLVIPPNGYFVVSQGLMAQTQLSDRLLIAAKASGTLPKELEEKVKPFSKDLLSTEEINTLPSNESASDVMKNMRERIEGKK
jgi:conjugal transfer pilus assembly protein TraF